jgi:hypothetical protein
MDPSYSRLSNVWKKRASNVYLSVFVRQSANPEAQLKVTKKIPEKAITRTG